MNQSPHHATETETIDAVVAYLRGRLEDYPEDLFPSPPKGEHGRTIDACSARAMRFILGACIKDFESGAWLDDFPVTERTSVPPGPGARVSGLAEAFSAAVAIMSDPVNRAVACACGTTFLSGAAAKDDQGRPICISCGRVAP